MFFTHPSRLDVEMCAYKDAILRTLLYASLMANRRTKTHRELHPSRDENATEMSVSHDHHIASADAVFEILSVNLLNLQCNGKQSINEYP